MIKVGIPRALSYYKFFPLWKSFFLNLGVEVIVSPPTNKDILDSGAKYVVDEVCLPVKVFFGHVNYLKDKVDYIFTPRVVSVEKKEYTCPKFMGIPDMLSTIDNLPRLIGPTIDITKNEKPLLKTILDVGCLFTNKHFSIIKAWFNANTNLKKFNQEWLKQTFPKELKIPQVRKENSDVALCVIGHEYILYDSYLSMNLLEKLAKLNVYIYTPEMLPKSLINNELKDYPKKIFWNFAKNSLGASFYYSRQENIKGFIHISSFGCGPDSMSSSMIMHHLKNKTDKPILNLTIDEHTGEAGINTRIEAFYDLLQRRVV
ncbi:MAG: acyl-CoA dehydratase activase-related protein [Peptococcales bacterium]|jgi:predicted nucleotide-binding protein (sugar kinase/HSP70/actin superfamily)